LDGPYRKGYLTFIDFLDILLRESNVTSSCQAVERVSILEFMEPESHILENLEKIASSERVDRGLAHFDRDC
jgi:hypothetical protein